MKKSILIVLLLCTALVSSQEKKNYKKVAAQFMDLYNKKDYKSIFEMFGADMKMALPLEKTIALFTNNIAPAGKIQKMEFLKLRNTAHVYKTTMDNAILDFTISLDNESKINGFFGAQHQPESKGPKLERNITKMQLPFNGEWTVIWGGTTVEQNYHVAYNDQKYAYDILMTKDGKSFKTNGKTNEDYYVFGKDIIAPCDAKVVQVITGVKDNQQKTIFIYNNCDHKACFDEVGAQAVSYTTGVPAMIGAALMLNKSWHKPGVWNMEQFDPDPFMDMLNEHGLPWHVIECESPFK